MKLEGCIVWLAFGVAIVLVLMAAWVGWVTHT